MACVMAATPKNIGYSDATPNCGKSQQQKLVWLHNGVLNNGVHGDQNFVGLR